MTRGQTPDLDSRICHHVDCDVRFTPAQAHQRFCSPAHRFDAARMRRALPLAIAYLEGVMAELDQASAE